MELSEMPSSLPSTTCEFMHNCTVSSGNLGIPVNVSGIYFEDAITSYVNDGTSIYGSKITCWDVSEVTNMDKAFQGSIFFDDPLCWDVSSVTTMIHMFYAANAFNQDISAWDVSNVTSMEFMFSNADAFNQDINMWDVSNVTNMTAMFIYTSAFNQDISAWDVSHVTSMSRMFQGADAFNQDINMWDVTSVTTMQYMFRSSAFNQSLCSWTSNSPQLLSNTTVDDMFLLSSCNNTSTPILNAGTLVDPHDGPFCFTC
jgi:surface protein